MLELLGQQIKCIRHKYDLTQEGLAQKAGISLRQLQNIEYGKADFKVSTLLKICEALKIDPKYIFENTHLHHEHSANAL